MNRRTLISAVAACALLAAPAVAGNLTVTTGWDLHHDTSPPMRDIAIKVAPPTGFQYEIPVQVRQEILDRARPDGAPDPLRQTDASVPAGIVPTPPPILSFEGLSDDDNSALLGTRLVPPDTEGDIGTTQYVQWVNIIWAVYNKNTGALLGGPFAGNSFWAGFGGDCQINNNGDPIVMFDDLAQRWVVSQFAPFSGIQCVAVSMTDDALGSYHRYAFAVSAGRFNDYPKLGVWNDGTTGSTGQSAYTFTVRDFNAALTAFLGVGAGVMQRDAMLNGAAAQFIKFDNGCTGSDCMDGQLPPHLDGAAAPNGTCPTFFSFYDEQFDDQQPPTTDGIRNHTLCVNWSNIGTSTYVENPFVATGAFDRALGNGFSPCITPVPAPGESLACLSIFTMFPGQYRWQGSNASVLVNTTVDVGGDRGAIRWAELRSTDGDSGWTLFQEGTYDGTGAGDRWMGSIAQDVDGNIALGYSHVSAAEFPSVRYSTRTPGDAPGTLPGGEVTCHQGTGVQTGSANRWGDYSAMRVDPVDDCTFWYTQEYYETTGSFDFTTRICSFRFDDCGDGGGGIPCEDVQRFQARCRAVGQGNRIQARVTMTDTSHNGEQVEVSVDGVPNLITIVNRVATLQINGATSGPHTVELTDPAGCFPAVNVNCP